MKSLTAWKCLSLTGKGVGYLLTSGTALEMVKCTQLPPSASEVVFQPQGHIFRCSKALWDMAETAEVLMTWNGLRRLSYMDV